MSQRTGIVIVVDDDAAVRNALKFALETEGLSVVLCEGGHELLGWQELPAGGCLVVDYRMPDMDGFELVSRLRERQISLPAILITSQVNADLRKRATEAGFVRSSRNHSTIPAFSIRSGSLSRQPPSARVTRYD